MVLPLSDTNRRNKSEEEWKKMKARLLFFCFLGKAVSLTCYQCPKVVILLGLISMLKDNDKQMWNNSLTILILFQSGKSGELKLQRWWTHRVVQEWGMVPEVLEQPRWWITDDEADVLSFQTKSLNQVFNCGIIDDEAYVSFVFLIQTN